MTNIVTRLPSVSIIIITRNSQQKLPQALHAIKNQVYPKHKIQIIAVDGGSTDNTLHILTAYRPHIHVIRGAYPDNQEARRKIGLMHATNEIVAYIDSDNYMPHTQWLKKMVYPFMVHPYLTGTFTLRYGYKKKDTLLNRYFALLGSADPVDHYLMKGERLSYAYDTWNRYGTILQQYPTYFTIIFQPNHFPTLGANGFLYRRKLLNLARLNAEHFVHVDAAYDLALQGFCTYAIVYDSIIHDTATTFWKFIKKRLTYILYYQLTSKDRLYNVFDRNNSEDVWKLCIFIFFSLTLIQPTLFAVKGYTKKHDSAWFVHPLYCFVITLAYGSALIIKKVKISYEKNR